MGQRRKIHFVTLGCPKNRVDTEVMLGHVAAAGYEPTAHAAEAQVIVVNTCGFIDAAKEESVDTIIRLGALKKEGQCEQLLVTGCLSQRYAPQLAKALPEVDGFLGTGNFQSIVAALEGAGEAQANDNDANATNKPAADGASAAPRSHAALQLARDYQPKTDHPRLRGSKPLQPFFHLPKASDKKPVFIPDPDFDLTAASPRIASQPLHSRYLKISEGCSNTCAFCIIPRLRGPQRSRTIADILLEAERLVRQGAVELTLVAQDLCAYGKDLTPRTSLAQLLYALNDLGDRLVPQTGRPLWIRCMYAYPKGFTDSTVQAFADCHHVLPYLDMPLQHISHKLLLNMKRGAGGAATRDLVAKLQSKIPHLTLRTTFITGLPGESDADFTQLLDFVREVRFAHVGVFTYSREDGTPAAEMEAQVPAEVAAARQAELMALARTLSAQRQQALVGQTLPVLIEGLAEETDLLVAGRHPGQAPEVDGCTYVTDGQAQVGEVVWVRVAQAGDYDVAGPLAAAPEISPLAQFGPQAAAGVKAQAAGL